MPGRQVRVRQTQIHRLKGRRVRLHLIRAHRLRRQTREVILERPRAQREPVRMGRRVRHRLCPPAAPRRHQRNKSLRHHRSEQARFSRACSVSGHFLKTLFARCCSEPFLREEILGRNQYKNEKRSVDRDIRQWRREKIQCRRERILSQHRAVVLRRLRIMPVLPGQLQTQKTKRNSTQT